MSLHTYLFFNGTCEKAIKFYAELLGGRIETMLTYGEAPMDNDLPADQQGRIMHAYLKLGDQALMASDSSPDWAQEMKGFAVQLEVPRPAEAERIFNALADGGEVRIPLEETFWAQRFGMLVDRFGVPWMVNCNKPEAVGSP